MSPRSPGDQTALGLMSGTSADGVEAALVRITSPPGPRVHLLAFRSSPYPEGLRRRVLLAGGEPGLRTAGICSLHREVGEAFADAALSLFEEAGIPPGDADFAGSHGQTVRHLPAGGPGAEGPLLPSTLQLGDPAVIAERTGMTVVSDFRARDVAAGGAGAPLTPWAHQVLFARKDKPAAFLNLGGIANLTYIPPSGSENLFGFDAGPANMLIDALAEKISNGKGRFDRNGELAAKGEADAETLDALLRHPFLSQSPPKSTGREEFGEAFLAEVLGPLSRRRPRPEDQLATLTAFSAECILRAIRDHFPEDAPPAEVIAGGGGIQNRTLTNLLKKGLKPIPLVSSAERGLPPEAVEAAAFALLAWGTLQGIPTNVPAATGAGRKAVLGAITPGGRFPFPRPAPESK